MKYIVLAALGAAVTGFLLGWDKAAVCRHALGVYCLDLL